MVEGTTLSALSHILLVRTFRFVSRMQNVHTLVPNTYEHMYGAGLLFQYPCVTQEKYQLKVRHANNCYALG